MSYNYFNTNGQILNQLMRQKDNVENLINQYSQPQAPVQNIINTGNNNLEFEARILCENEEVDNILINKRTMFLDKSNKRVVIKELDGKISEEYEIVIPLDPKDKKILELENRLKEMEEKLNNEYAEFNKSNNGKSKSSSNDNESDVATTTSNSKKLSK